MSFQFHEVFPRVQMKTDAKAALRGNWLTAIAVTILYSIFSYLGSYAILKMMLPGISMQTFLLNSQELFTDFQQQMPAMAENPQVMGLVALVSLIVGVLLSGIFQIAFNMWSLAVVERDEENTGLAGFFGFFAYGINGALLFIWMNLWLLIWMLPFFVALGLLVAFAGNGSSALFGIGVALIMLGLAAVAIWKSIQYSMAFFALADDPDLGARRALRLSIERTEGQIGQLLLMYLSFFGWLILTSIVPPVQLYVTPYMNVSFANAWRFLRPGGIDGRPARETEPVPVAQPVASPGPQDLPADSVPPEDRTGLPSDPAEHDWEGPLDKEER
ncbi:DUF975 family protein [Peptococcus simiae]|uniref:DUF975 family protein n=1 Tax=Peptococcus simiae TaxID=1643805 RepID=A0ABW9GXM0_9FIRM